MLSKLAKSWTRESFVSLRFQAKAFTQNGDSVLWWDCRHANGMNRQTPPVARNPSLSLPTTTCLAVKIRQVEGVRLVLVSRNVVHLSREI